MTRGSCLRGGVRFAICGAFDTFYLCHCSRCRKDSGSAHSANLFSASATVEWLAGGDHIKHYRVPESRHERSFCSECGSALPSVKMGGALLAVPAGSLDDAIALRPTAHICDGSRAEWEVNLDRVARLEGLPG